MSSQAADVRTSPSRAGGAAGSTPSATPRRRNRYLWTDMVSYLLVVVAFIWALFPVVFIVSAAFDPAGTLSTSSLIPRRFSFKNFQMLFNDPARPYLAWYVNSIIICLLNGFVAVFVGAISAYAFSRLKFRGRRGGLFLLLLLQLFPGILAFVALYTMFAAISDVIPELGLNTLTGLLLAYSGGAMGANVWLLKGYFDSVPRELDEAARVDGASHARIFFTIIVPLVRPILVTVFMLSFIGTFGEFMLAGIFLTDADNQTLAVGLNSMLRSDRNRYFGQFCAGALLASAPIMVLYLAFQKNLTGGLTAGSVK